MSFLHNYTSPNVRNVRQITLNEELKTTILSLPRGEERLELAKQNSQKTNAYKFEYESNGYWVVGYLLEPKNLQEELPVIIKNRGGSREVSQWSDGHMFGTYTNRYIDWGYIVLMTQYGGNDGGEGRDEFGGADLQDVLNLKKIVDNYRFADEKRIGMLGGSRGGLMTYLALREIEWLKAAVVNSAPTDLHYTYTYREQMKEFHREMYNVGSDKELDKRSVLKFYKEMHKVPLLIFHGTADERVKVKESLNLYGKLLEIKYPAQLTFFAGADHYLREVFPEASRQTRDWFARFLLQKEEAPNMEPHGN